MAIKQDAPHCNFRKLRRQENFTPRLPSGLHALAHFSTMESTNSVEGPLFLPVEIIDGILDFIVLDKPREAATVSYSRRQLSRCSLASRHWAMSLRPRLFGLLHLRTLEELRELAGFASCPHSLVSGYISQLRVAHSEKSMPWCHAIHSLLVPKLPFDTRTALRVELTVGPCIGPQHGLLQSVLPRRLPSSIYTIHRLNVVSTYFRSFADLLQLVGSLPLLEVIYCFEVSCEQESATTADLPYCPESTKLREVVVLQCSFGWEALWFFVGRRRSPKGPIAAGSGQYQAQIKAPLTLGRIMRGLTQGGEPDPGTVWGNTFRHGRFDLMRRDGHVGQSFRRDCRAVRPWLNLGYADIMYRWISSGSLLADTKLPVPGVVLSLGYDGDGPRSISIAVDCHAEDRYDFESTSKCDWEGVFSLLPDLPMGSSLTVGLSCTDDWYRFRDEFAPKSARKLSEAGTLRVAYWDSLRRSWVHPVRNDQGDLRARKAYPQQVELTCAIVGIPPHFSTTLTESQERDMIDERMRFVRMMESSW